MKKVRFFIFLKDVLRISLLSFGGPQAHLALFFKILVEKRRYLSEEELIELNSFCNLLPGPASTQTLTAVGFRIGGPVLAFLTLLVWILPATIFMIAAALCVENLKGSIEIARYIQPMAVSFVAYAAIKVCKNAIKTKIALFIYLLSGLSCYFINYPGIFPIILLLGGFITAFRFKKHSFEEKEQWNMKWGNFILLLGIFASAALIGNILDYKPIKLFENFFRNGSLIFGGGQPLTGLLHKEFVEFKHYLSNDEFTAGYAVLQGLPGPLFSFSSFIGCLSMKEYNIVGEIAGGFIAAIGIFLPGILMIFFMIDFWGNLKKYRPIKASMEGINAASAGIILATTFLLIKPMFSDSIGSSSMILNFGIFGGTLLGLQFSKIPPPFFILTGLLVGIFVK